MAPVSKPPAAEIEAGTQNNSVAEEQSSHEPSPVIEQPMDPTQSLPSLSPLQASQQQSEPQSDKRQRVNGDDDQSQDDVARSQDLRDIVSFLTESLGTPTKAIADSLTKQIKKAHSSFLDLQRQITAIKEKQSNKENPHGWKVREVPLGVNNAALEQKIVEAQNVAAQKILSLILTAKQADAKQAYADRAEALTLALDGHKASVQRIVAANPGRYDEANIAAVMEHATVILASKSIEAEVATDLAYDNVARKRADKQLAFQEMSASKQTLGDEDGDKPVTRSELKQWQADMEKNNKPRGRPPKTARDTSNHSKAGDKKAGDKRNQKNAGDKNSKSTGGAKKNSGGGRGKNNSRGKHQQPGKQPTRHADPTSHTASPTAAITKRAVVNLTPSEAPADLVRALGLGPSFRPTPPPLTDQSIVKALRHFSRRVKTAAFHALFPQPSSEDYIPKLYLPTGRPCDPECDALDTCLDQYQSTIATALTLSATASTPDNMSKSETLALRELEKQLKEGNAEFIPIPADKDRAYTLVSQTQHTALWTKAMSGDQYLPVEPDSVDWTSVQRAVRLAAKRALDAGTISKSTHRFLTQHCIGTVREPKGNLLVKTHKPMQPSTAVPAKTRLYIDTVNCVSTPLAKFISVQLTAPRELIRHRIKDSRHLLSELSQMTFTQSVRIIIIDVTDFYPNTATPDGEAVMERHLEPSTASLCVEFSRIIHDSMVVSTPVGSFKVPDSYGIGFGHSAEVCDLNYADTVETPVLTLLNTEGIVPDFYGRMIDDIIMIIDCTDAEVDRIEHLFQTTDPSKPVTFKHSTQSADYLDITVFKGPQFTLTGKFDTKLYTKPSSSSLHLPRQSHHPESTFNSILSGTVRRSVVASSNWANHQHEMLSKRDQFFVRGYSSCSLTESLDLQKSHRRKQIKKKQSFKQLRRKILQPKAAADETDRVIALKLPFTCRTMSLQKHLKVTRLQKHINTNCPALSRASLGRFVIANLRTRNIRDQAKFKPPSRVR